MNYEEAKKYFEEAFKPESAATRLALWAKENPTEAPKAKKAEEKKEE